MIKTGITRRQFSTGLAGSAAIAGICPPFARAQQGYPNRPVRFILPFGAAGVADITSRLAAEKLGDKLGQRFVVENQPGPGGIAAARSVLSQPPDGYTIGLVTNGTSISAAIYKALPFDPVKSIRHDLDHRLVRPGLRHQRGVRVQDAAGLHQGSARAAGQAQCRHHQCRRHSEPRGGVVQVARPGSTSRSSPIAARPTSSLPCCATTCSCMVDFYAPMKPTLLDKKIRAGRHLRHRALAVLHRRADGRRKPVLRDTR